MNTVASLHYRKKSRWSPTLSAALLAGIEVSAALRSRWNSLAHEPVLVVANHISLWDGPLLAALAPVRIVGVIDQDWYDNLLLRGMLRAVASSLGDVVALSARHPCGLRTVLNCLRRGAHVVIFPSGGIGIEEQQPGLMWLQSHAPGVARLDLVLRGTTSRYRRPYRIELSKGRSRA